MHYLLIRIEAFLKWKPMSATRFGRQVMKDPTFVARLRDGRPYTFRTKRKCFAYINRHRRRRDARRKSAR